MSCKEYQKVYDKMSERQKDAMHELYMTGINHDCHAWVTYGDVEKAVAKLLMADIDMKIDEDKQESFKQAVAPLHTWLCKYGHPHMTVMVRQNGAEASEGVVAVSLEVPD